MKSLTITELNFKEISTNTKEYKINNSLEIESPKNFAYVIRWQLARNRTGSANTKKMSEISGTTAKPWKQKGTGRARQGSKRSVQFVGGRTCHGPQPRNFDFSIPKKIAKLALTDAIKLKLLNNQILVYSDDGKIVKTSNVVKTLKSNNINNAVLIHGDKTSKLALGARNIKNLKIISNDAINSLDLINYQHVIIDTETFKNKIIGAFE